MDVANAFNFTLHVPELDSQAMETVLDSQNVFSDDEIPKAVEALGQRIPIKKLFLLVEMVKQKVHELEDEALMGGVSLQLLLQCLEDLDFTK